VLGGENNNAAVHKKRYMMIHQNFKGDFIRIERFQRVNEDGVQVEIPVPDHVRIEYFTKGFSGKYIVERNGGQCNSCTLSEDGLSLISNIALSRSPIGCGEMFAVITIFEYDAEFREQVRVIPVSVSTGVLLWPGNSDDSVVSRGDNILSPVLYGHSAYELAKRYGYSGTEEEYAMEPVRIVEQFEEIVSKMCLTIGIDNNPQVISHGLDRFPSVTVISSEGEAVECVVRYESRDVVSVSWSGDLTGKIYLI